MIKKILLSILVGILSLSGGCSYLPWFESESEPEVVEPISESPPVAESEEIDVALEPPSSSTEVAGLIAPTDPNQQRSAIAQGRPDPFNPLSVPPVVTVNPAEPGSSSLGSPSASPSSSSPARSSLPAPPASKPARSPAAPPASNPSRSLPSSSSPARSPAAPPASNPSRSLPSSSSPARSPAASPASSPARSLPPVAVKPAPHPSPGGPNAPLPSKQPSTPPQPVAAIAQDVVVTGVIQVGNTTQIILKAPNEAHSRYVQLGQYLANQQVLVKRVDRQNEVPVVVLEQNGIEVFKSVGEKAQEVSYDKSESSIALVSSSEVG